MTSPIIGPRTMEHLQSQLPALELRLSPTCSTALTRSWRPGTDLNDTDVGWVPAAIADPSLRRRPLQAAARQRGLLDAVASSD